MSKKKIFIWCCDLNKNSGEGIIANKFINDLQLNNSGHKLIIKYPENKSRNMLVERFIHPLRGLIYLWKIYIFYKNKNICYVNYLPFWNFILFLLLPPKTILGPITGGSLFNTRPIENYILRKYFLNTFNYLTALVTKIRGTKLLFSTDLLKNKIYTNKKNIFNYVLKDFKIKKIKTNKYYDLIFYLRAHKNKNIQMQIDLANKLSKKFKIITVGEKIPNPDIKNFGYIKRKNLLKILKKTKFTFLSPENLLSLFALDSISCNTNIFFNKNKNYKSNELKGIFYVDYEDKNKLNYRIEKQLVKKFIFKIKYKNSQKKFDNYFKL